MAVPTKQYGLILPQKKGGSKPSILQKTSVFGDDSDDETSVGESLQKEAAKKKMMKQTRLEMQKALEQDSTVYDYDGVYDDIQKQRLESNKKILHGADKRPKYIHQLMKAVEDRKKEQERREERKIQKEREAEGEQFADKEAYVTSAYRQKLKEQEEEREREKREAQMEAALDVKKQKDLSGFYRHLLNQTVGEEAIPDRSANKAQPGNVSKDTERISPVSVSMPHDSISSDSDNEEGPEQKTGFSKPATGSAHSKRQYRQRSPSSGSGEEREKEKERDRHKKSHRDQDRDRGRDRDRERDRNRDRDRDRNRERDERHGGRRDDRDRRKDRDRGREDDRSRSKADAGREDRYGKRERSPKEREREKNGERDRRRNDEEKQKDRHREEEKEKKTEPEKERVVNKEEKEEEHKETRKEREDVPPEEGKDEETKEETVNKFAKRSTDQTVTSARDRYMARQMARSSCKTYIEKEED